MDSTNANKKIKIKTILKKRSTGEQLRKRILEEGVTPSKQTEINNLLDKYGKRKVHYDVPEMPGLGDGFQVRFRLSKAYRALEKQEHIASKPNIQPYSKAKKADGLDEMDDRAPAYLWADEEEEARKKKRHQSKLIWNILGLKKEKEKDDKDEEAKKKEKENEEKKKKMRKELSEAELLKKKIEDSKKYAKLLCSSLKVTKSNKSKEGTSRKEAYFQGMKNLAAAKAKASQPFRERRVKPAEREKDPEKIEKLRQARENLKARSKYSSFWKKKNETQEEEEKEKEKAPEVDLPKMAWCAAESSLSMMEWEAKKRHKMAKKRNERSGSRTQSKTNPRSEARNASPPNAAPEVKIEKEDSEEDKSSEHENYNEGTDELFKNMLTKKSLKVSPYQIRPKKSADGSSSKSGKSSRSGSRRNSVLSDVIEEDEEEKDTDSGEDFRSDHGFASLLGSSSESSENSDWSEGSEESDDSEGSAGKLYAKSLKNKRSNSKSKSLGLGRLEKGTVNAGNDRGTTMDDLKRKYGPRPKSCGSRPSSVSFSGRSVSNAGGSKRKGERGVKTCRYLYRMCGCQKVSQKTTLHKLLQNGKAVGTIDVYGCHSDDVTQRRCKSAEPRLESNTSSDITCPFCSVFPKQRIRAWMRFNEIMMSFESQQ